MPIEESITVYTESFTKTTSLNGFVVRSPILRPDGNSVSLRDNPTTRKKELLVQLVSGERDMPLVLNPNCQLSIEYVDQCGKTKTISIKNGPIEG